MKTLYKLLILSLVLFSTFDNYAQIDTTIYYPLQVGNYWQFGTLPPSEVFQTYQIIGEATFDGKLYYKFREYDGEYETIRYFRPEGENNEQIYRYVGVGCQNGEGLYYDFTVPDSSIWPSCASIGIYTSLIYTEWKYIDFLNESFTTFTIVDADIDSTVTPPDTLYYRFYYEKIAKGIGVVEWYGELSPLYILEGAIINNVHYGNTSLFVAVDEPIMVSDQDYVLNQNYPNPFNPETRITYSIKEEGLVILEVYNLLGEKISNLVQEFQTRGNYSVEFDASGLPTGIYVYTLRVNDFRTTNKMLFIK